MSKAPVPLIVSVPPCPPLSLISGALMLLVVQVPARQPMEPPAACVATADGEDAAAAVFEGALAGLPDELLAGLDDPPHAASRVSRAAAAAAVPATACGRIPLLVKLRAPRWPRMVFDMPQVCRAGLQPTLGKSPVSSLTGGVAGDAASPLWCARYGSAVR